MYYSDKNFIECRDENDAPVFVNRKYIRAVYYDEEKDRTAIDYGEDLTFFVQEYVEDVMDKIRRKEAFD